MEFGLMIKDIRQQCYLSQQAFADEIGVSFTTVNRWESGKYKPTIKTKRKLAPLFEIIYN